MTWMGNDLAASLFAPELLQTGGDDPSRYAHSDGVRRCFDGAVKFGLEAEVGADRRSANEVDGQIGHEDTLDEFVNIIAAIFDEIRRILSAMELSG
jgi:hypothetical protein